MRMLTSLKEEFVNRSILSLTRKDINRQPVGSLVLDMQFIKRLTDTYSLYSFVFDPQDGPKLQFLLAGDNCVSFFNLLDDVLSPDTTTPTPPELMLSTSDATGEPRGELRVTVAKVATFEDDVSLFSYSFILDGAAAFDFMLTSTDAGGFFLDFDAIIWSNFPNPPH